MKKSIAIISLACLAGCMDTSPASRATSAKYGDIEPRMYIEVHNSTGVVVTASMPYTMGDGALASADSSGSTETQTATPTMEVKPDLTVQYAQGGSNSSRGGSGSGSSAAGILESLTAQGLASLKSYLTSGESGTVSLATKDGGTVTAECADGSCTINGVKISSADCANCSPQ